MKISVVINTFNAEEFLERVLESIRDFEEVLICDMHSTDRTVEIAGKFPNCRVIYHDYTGGIAEPAREYAIKQAAHEWVLVIDADEIVPQALKNYLYEYTDSGRGAGLNIPRKNYLMGRFMRCAYPDYILRFFMRDKTTWAKNVHSLPVVDGHVDTIPSRRKDLAFIHLGNEPIRVTINKMNRYTEMEVERRRNRNYGWGALLFHPMVRFMRFYIFKGGILDGKPGFIWAKEYAYYKFITVAKVIEAKVDPAKWDKDLRP